MDPLSASASVIAVLGALISSLKAADRVIRNLHDAPRELRSLEVEVLDVKAVMADVSIASQLQIENFKTTSSSGDSESSNEILRPSSALPDCLTRAKDIISRLEGTISDSVVCSGGGSYKIRRVAWLKNRKKAEQLRRELKSLKTNLDILLISKAM